MIKKRILVDMDGILANLQQQWLDTYNEECEDDVRVQDITTWEMHHHVKIGRGIYEIPGRLNYFDATPPMAGAIAGFNALRKAGHEVLVCSSPYNADSARAKHEWCKRFLKTKTRDVILTHHKDLIECDTIIDDKPDTIRAFAKRGKEVITIAYPFNKSVESYCALRAQNMLQSRQAWEEIVEFLT